MSRSVTFGDLTFEVRRSAKRRTVGITVDRGGDLVIYCPLDCPLDTLERIVQEKRFWIYTKLAEKEQLFDLPAPKEFVNGEGFHYLGRSYRLLIVEPGFNIPMLSLTGGRFRLRHDALIHAPQHFTDWYIRNGQPWIERRVELFQSRIGVTPTTVKVRDLGYRWASCGKNDGLNFHWRVMVLPPRVIEYLVAHEMIHLLIAHHDEEFWLRLERVMPDMVARKQWLAENGARF